jgi:hypothetical protein
MNTRPTVFEGIALLPVNVNPDLESLSNTHVETQLAALVAIADYREAVADPVFEKHYPVKS